MKVGVKLGKVDKDTYLQSTESMQADYSMVMPFLVKALLDNRERYRSMPEQDRPDSASGYLRAPEGYRLYDRRDILSERLTEDVRKNGDWLLSTLSYPLASKT